MIQELEKKLVDKENVVKQQRGPNKLVVGNVKQECSE